MLTSRRRSWAVFLGLVVALTTLTHAQRGRAPLADAARDGDMAAVRALLAQDVDVNTGHPDGSTALLWAAYQSNLLMAQTLIEAGIDVNAGNSLGVTPLVQASAVGDAAMVEALITAGADPNLGPRERTALMAASRAGSVETVRLLLAAGADVNALEAWDDQTALMWAAGEGHAGVIRLLLEAGADADVVSRATELESRAHADHPTGGMTAVMFAAREGHTDAVRALAAGGADLDHANPDNATAMILAIVNDHFDTAAALLDLGANPDDGSLFHAVEMRDMTTDVLVNDPTRLRPNHDNSIDALGLAERLVAAGANPNTLFAGALHSVSTCCASGLSGTPLHRAAQTADVDLLRLLLDAGGDPNIVPPAGQGRRGRGAAPPGQTALMLAMSGGGGPARGGGPGTNTRDGGPPFREAANRDPIESVRLLVEAGADVDATTPEGDTALHLAAQNGLVPVIQILADAGATLDLPNQAGLTPLDLASGRRPEAAGGGGPGGGRGRGGGPPQPQIDAIILLQELQGLPVELPEAPGAAAAEGSNE